MKNAIFWDMALCCSCKNQRSSEISVAIRATQCHIPENSILLLLKYVSYCWLQYEYYSAMTLFLLLPLQLPQDSVELCVLMNRADGRTDTHLPQDFYT
jgi:hypothetical protein